MRTPFKVGTLYFFSKPKYEAFRKTLTEQDCKKFKAVPALRLELERNKNDINATTHYLTDNEIQEAKEQGLFSLFKN